MTWDPISNPVDHIVLAGKKSPGLAVVQNADRVRKWDKRKARAQSGGTLVYQGDELSDFDVKITLISDQDWAGWNAWKPIVDTAPAGRGASAESRYLDIVHPILAEQGIVKAVVQRVSQPVEVSKGIWEVTIAFIEGREPKKALAKPKGSASSTAQQEDPNERRIRELTAQYQDLAAQ